MSQEKYTPGPWKFEAGNIVDRADNTIAQVYGVAYTHGNANGKLIAEAPNMFPLLKEFIMSHVVAKGGELCDCNDCRAAKRIVARVLGEE